MAVVVGYLGTGSRDQAGDVDSGTGGADGDNRPMGDPVGERGGHDRFDIVLTDHDVLPRQLAAAVEDADHLEIVDPLSFPFEDLPDDGWIVPMTVHLPDLDFEVVCELLDRPILSKLTVFDAVAAGDELWDRLQPWYGWPQSMRLTTGPLHRRLEVDLVNAAANELRRRDISPYGNWPIRSRSHKARLVAVASAIERVVRPAVDSLPRAPVVQLHGWAVQPYVPLLWRGLTVVIERRPAGLSRLRHQYHRPRFRLLGATERALVESADVVVGVGLLEQGNRVGLQRSFNDLFANLRVGGAMVVAERFDGDHGPTDLVERLLDASAHNLVLDQVEPVRVATDGPTSYGVMALTKLGVPGRL